MTKPSGRAPCWPVRSGSQGLRFYNKLPEYPKVRPKWCKKASPSWKEPQEGIHQEDQAKPLECYCSCANQGNPFLPEKAVLTLSPANTKGYSVPLLDFLNTYDNGLYLYSKQLRGGETLEAQCHIGPRLEWKSN